MDSQLQVDMAKVTGYWEGVVLRVILTYCRQRAVASTALFAVVLPIDTASCARNLVTVALTRAEI